MIKKLEHLHIKMIFIIAIVTLLALSFLSYYRTNNLINESSLVNRTNLVKLSLANILNALSDKESNMRIYMFSKDSAYLSLYLTFDTIINSELTHVASLIKDNPAQQQNRIELQTAINKRIELMKHNLALFHASNITISDRLNGNVLMVNVRNQIGKMIAEEDKLLVDYSEALGKSSFASPLFIILLIIGSIAILIVSYSRIVLDQKKSDLLTSKVEQRTNELIQANKDLTFQNEEKAKRSAELIIANKELEAFNYISSHDLQEPLRKIQAFTSRLTCDESRNLSIKGKDYVLRIEDAANRMQNLIADLLAYSRTTSTEQKFETTNLNTIIELVKNDFADTIAEKNAIIDVFEMCDAPIIPFQFRQLMDNIIGNALKFAKPDLSSHIIIKSRIIKGSEVNNEKHLSEKEYCHITITDNGIGFEPKYKDHIFELFKRLRDKENIKGTGIGLAIVKKIIESHNGFIMATSEPNKGASFDIYIPAS